jgi:3-oxoacyl-[acyl-carrier protein] reductase
MHQKFKGKHILITGAARGIGFEIARQFIREGAELTLLDRDEMLLEEAVKKLGPKSQSLRHYLVDVSKREQVNAAIDEIEKESPIDVLINNAGICLVTPFLNITPEEWQATLDVNLTGVFNVSQSVCRYFVKRKKGVVINMSSKNGLDGELGHAHYNASKAGVIMLTKTIAIELAHLGVRANAVCPGYVRSPINTGVDTDEFVETFADRYIPMNRVGNVEEIAPIFLFLASEEASYINGQTFIIDGGQLAGQKPWKDLLKNIAN